eukprot:scaffold223833_cov17-Tisochrysis_lutea.AAC.1
MAEGTSSSCAHIRQNGLSPGIARGGITVVFAYEICFVTAPVYDQLRKDWLRHTRVEYNLQETCSRPSTLAQEVCIAA